jgi:CBS domain-containing protein
MFVAKAPPSLLADQEVAMIVSELMTRDVVSVSADARLEDAVRLMAKHSLSGLPVVETDGTVVGVLTGGDLLRRVEIGTAGKEPNWFAMIFLPGSCAVDYVRTHGRSVRMLMTPAVVSISPGADIAEAARLMQQHRFKRLPVVENRHLIGIISRTDLIKALGSALQSPAAASDSELRTRLSAELAKQDWAPKADIEASVKDGVVELSGTIAWGWQRDALRALAEAAGAREVHENLALIEPVGAAAFD